MQDEDAKGGIVRNLTKGEEERALAIHQRAIVIDALNASIMDEDYWQKMQRGSPRCLR